jgi:phosphonate transport system substrate-binding protein
MSHKFRFLRLAAYVILTGTLSALCGCSHQSAPEQFKVGVIPFEDASAIQTHYKPFADYLGNKVGSKGGEVFVTSQYAGILAALRADQIDCAYLNPLSYVLAVQEYRDTPEHLVPIGMPYFHHSPTYRGIIFVRADSGIKTVRDFKGKTFAFADRSSTSGYLYPAGLMKEAGLDPSADVKSLNISGNASVLAVLNKRVDGGASYEGAIEMALKDPAQAKQLVVIAKTDPIPNGMFVVRGNLSADKIAKLKQALIDINTEPAGQTALNTMEYDKIVPADDRAFDPLRKKAAILGLSLQSLDEKKK